MRWYISKERDSDDEVQYRRQFYSELTGRSLSLENSHANWFFMSDGRKDNRCMIIGHTNTVYEVMALLKNSRMKRKYYVCSCAMSLKELKAHTSRIDNDSVVYLSKQTLIEVREVSTRYRDGVLACKFFDKDETGFGFKITQSELNMFHSNLTGFHNKLDTCFTQI